MKKPNADQTKTSGFSIFSSKKGPNSDVLTGKLLFSNQTTKPNSNTWQYLNQTLPLYANTPSASHISLVEVFLFCFVVFNTHLHGTQLELVSWALFKYASVRSLYNPCVHACNQWDCNFLANPDATLQNPDPFAYTQSFYTLFKLNCPSHKVTLACRTRKYILH